MKSFFSVALVSIVAAWVATASATAEIRIGLIGLDTSHVIAFTRLINQTDRSDHVPGGKVIAAFKGGSPDVEASYTRVDRSEN